MLLLACHNVLSALVWVKPPAVFSAPPGAATISTLPHFGGLVPPVRKSDLDSV